MIKTCYIIKKNNWNFPGGPVVKPSPSNAGGTGLIPDWGAKIPHASGLKSQNIKQKQYCNKFSEDFKNSPHLKKSLKIKLNFEKFLNKCFKCLKRHYLGKRSTPYSLWERDCPLPSFSLFFNIKLTST